MKNILRGLWRIGVVGLVVFISGVEARGTPAYIEDCLRGLMIPNVKFQNTPLREALDFLREKSVELNLHEPDPTKREVNIVLYTGVGENKLGDTPITLKMENVSLGNALKRIAALAKMKYVIEPHAALIVPLKWKAPEKIGGEEFAATRAIIIPNFEFQNAPLASALVFLQQKSMELDFMEKSPAKKGIKIALQPDPFMEVKDVKISLRLQNVPLATALRYAAMQAGMQCKYESRVVRIVPLTGKKK